MPNDPIVLPIEISAPGTWVLSQWTANKFNAVCGLKDNSLCLLLGGSAATELALGKPLNTHNSDIDFYFQGKDPLARQAVDCMREVVGSKLAKILGFNDKDITNWKTKYTDNLDSSKSYYLITVSSVDYNIGTRIIYSNFQISIDVETGSRVYDPNIPSHEVDFLKFEKNKEIITYKIDDLIQNAADQKGFSIIAFVFKSYVKHLESGCNFSEETAEAIRNIKKYNPLLMNAIGQRLNAFYNVSQEQSRMIFERAEQNYSKNNVDRKNRENELMQKLFLAENEARVKDEKNQKISKELEKTRESLVLSIQSAQDGKKIIESQKKTINDTRSTLGTIRAQAAKKEAELEAELEKLTKAMWEQGSTIEKLNENLRKKVETSEKKIEKLKSEMANNKLKVNADQATGARIVAAVHVRLTQEKTDPELILVESLFTKAASHLVEIENNPDDSEKALFAMARESLACISSESHLIGFLALFREMKEFEEKHDLFQRFDFRLVHSLELCSKEVKMSFDERLQLIKGSLFAFIKMVEIGFIRKHPIIDQRISAIIALFTKLTNDKEYCKNLEILDNQLNTFKTKMRPDLKSKLPSVSEEILKNLLKDPDNELCIFIVKYKKLKKESGNPLEAEHIMSLMLDLTKSGDLKGLAELEKLYDQCLREMIEASLKRVEQSSKPIQRSLSTACTSKTHVLQYSNNNSVAKAFIYAYCGQERTNKIDDKKIRQLDNMLHNYLPENVAGLGVMMRAVKDNNQQNRLDAAHSIARSFSADGDFEVDYKRFLGFFNTLNNKQIIDKDEYAFISKIMERAKQVHPLAENLKPLRKCISYLESMSQSKTLESSMEFNQVLNLLSPLSYSFKPDELQYTLLLVAYEDNECENKKPGMLAVANKLLNKIKNLNDPGQSSSAGRMPTQSNQ